MDASGFSAPSLAPSPLSATPSSQFAAGVLSALFAAQQSPASAQTVAGGAHRRHHNHHVGADIGSDATDYTAPAAGAASTSSDAAADETTSNSGATAVQSAITAAA